MGVADISWGVGGASTSCCWTTVTMSIDPCFGLVKASARIHTYIKVHDCIILDGAISKGSKVCYLPRHTINHHHDDENTTIKT